MADVQVVNPGKAGFTTETVAAEPARFSIRVEHSFLQVEQLLANDGA